MITGIEAEPNITFSDCFADVYPKPHQFSEDGLLSYDQYKITILPAGHLLIRNIGMAVDFYMQ